MPKLELGEPLLTDQELSGVGERLMAEFPLLRVHDSDLVTWLQAPQELVGDSGLVTKLPEVAVFGVRTGDMLTKGAVYLRDFESESSADGQPHPALQIFRPVVREHLRLLGALEGIQDGSTDRSIQRANI